MNLLFSSDNISKQYNFLCSKINLKNSPEIKKKYENILRKETKSVYEQYKDKQGTMKLKPFLEGINGKVIEKCISSINNKINNTKSPFQIQMNREKQIEPNKPVKIDPRGKFTHVTNKNFLSFSNPSNFASFNNQPITGGFISATGEYNKNNMQNVRPQMKQPTKEEEELQSHYLNVGGKKDNEQLDIRQYNPFEFGGNNKPSEPNFRLDGSDSRGNASSPSTSKEFEKLLGIGTEQSSDLLGYNSFGVSNVGSEIPQQQPQFDTHILDQYIMQHPEYLQKFMPNQQTNISTNTPISTQNINSNPINSNEFDSKLESFINERNRTVNYLPNGKFDPKQSPFQDPPHQKQNFFFEKLNENSETKKSNNEFILEPHITKKPDFISHLLALKNKLQKILNISIEKIDEKIIKEKQIIAEENELDIEKLTDSENYGEYECKLPFNKIKITDIILKGINITKNLIDLENDKENKNYKFPEGCYKLNEIIESFNEFMTTENIPVSLEIDIENLVMNVGKDIKINNNQNSIFRMLNFIDNEYTKGIHSVPISYPNNCIFKFSINNEEIIYQKNLRLNLTDNLVVKVYDEKDNIVNMPHIIKYVQQ